jgi:calcyclin binding protein
MTTCHVGGPHFFEDFPWSMASDKKRDTTTTSIRSKDNWIDTMSETMEIEEIATTTTVEPAPMKEESTSTPAWQERLADAEEILSLAASENLRPTARMHLEALGKKLQKESAALQRVAGVAPIPGVPVTREASETAITTVPEATPTIRPAVTVILPTSVKYAPIDRFAFDAGGYNAPFVTLYIEMEGIGSGVPKDQISCQFTKTSFDLVIHDFQGKSYRLYKDCLEKDIVPEQSKYLVKADKIVIKLAKTKSEYGGSYEYWTKLTDPKKNTKTAANKKEDPSASIMDMMKQMYDEGDDNMKKMIGETMMKQRNGELGKKGPGGGLAGMDDMDDF